MQTQNERGDATLTIKNVEGFVQELVLAVENKECMFENKECTLNHVHVYGMSYDDVGKQSQENVANARQDWISLVRDATF